MIRRLRAIPTLLPDLGPFVRGRFMDWRCTPEGAPRMPPAFERELLARDLRRAVTEAEWQWVRERWAELRKSYGCGGAICEPDDFWSRFDRNYQRLMRGGF